MHEALLDISAFYAPTTAERMTTKQLRLSIYKEWNEGRREILGQDPLTMLPFLESPSDFHVETPEDRIRLRGTSSYF